ncbi:hypothetical protein NDU88_006689 [Pleurodeles waltl]|uniref:Uncharacterized protein n=1 Tax=Pleurodeles waltl TaxID=8319 RepID=A0AAV7QLG8_PLEWA|nr:hypothetical protein NDU88_006689 [Pleurodeles waltl]
MWCSRRSLPGLRMEERSSQHDQLRFTPPVRMGDRGQADPPPGALQACWPQECPGFCFSPLPRASPTVLWLVLKWRCEARPQSGARAQAPTARGTADGTPLQTSLLPVASMHPISSPQRGGVGSTDLLLRSHRLSQRVPNPRRGLAASAATGPAVSSKRSGPLCPLALFLGIPLAGENEN